jgi:hypothetical protein
MPTIIIKGFKFRFYSSDRGERPHTHVRKSRKWAKIWLQPVELQRQRGYNEAEISEILELAQQHQKLLLEAWREHFGH